MLFATFELYNVNFFLKVSKNKLMEDDGNPGKIKQKMDPNLLISQAQDTFTHFFMRKTGK